MDPSAPVAAFDLDGTITQSDTLRLVLRRGIRRGPSRPWAALGLPGAWQAARRDVAQRGAFKAAALNLLFGGRSRAWLDRFAATFTRHVLDYEVKPGARAAIDRHRAAGHTLVLATASPDLWANPIGQALGFEHVIATRLAWADDRFTGKLDGLNLLHEQKRLAVLAFLAERAGGARLHAAYTDHHHDLPMLLLAENPVAVDPTPGLAAEAAARNIPIQNWH
jgi:HAD superfamily hydrolase (TIGR01490 family)